MEEGTNERPVSILYGYFLAALILKALAELTVDVDIDKWFSFGNADLASRYLISEVLEMCL